MEELEHEHSQELEHVHSEGNLGYINASMSEALKKVVGQNILYDPIFPNIPKEIGQSPTNKYYILFQSDDYPTNAQEAFNRISLTSKITFREFSDEDLTKQTDAILDRDLVYFKEFGFAIVNLEPNDFDEFSRKDFIDFAIIPEAIYQDNTHLGKPPTKKSKKTLSWNISRIVQNPNATLKLTGTGVNVAVLDTGLHFSHKAFSNQQNIPSHSFITPTADDDHGHGTHCAGILCGSGLSNKNTVFGIAPDVNLHVCKILDRQKRGTQTNVILGIKWAVKHKCDIISLSVSKSNPQRNSFDLAYERVISWAKSKGTLTVVAAGNDSYNRPHQIEPIGSPSDCPSAIAVTAIDSNNLMYSLSNGADTQINQSVTFTAPGVKIHSSWIKRRYVYPTGFLTKEGTSFAAPHVAAILALYKARNPHHTMAKVLQEAINKAKKLNNISPSDQGNGLIYFT